MPLGLSVLAAAAAIPAATQSTLRSVRAAESMPETYTKPAGDPKGGRYKTSAAITNHQGALASEEAQQR